MGPIQKATESRVSGMLDDPRAHAAVLLAARLDAPDASDRDRVALSRELRLVMAELEEAQPAAVPSGDNVFDLSAALRRTEKRRGSA